MKRLLGLSTLIWLALACFAHAQEPEKRIALVIGNAAYQQGALATAANDAGLIAQTLQAAGFDVVGARDLDQDSLRRAFRDFVEKATGSGPGTVAFVYVSGYGLQLEGENYFVPIDAKIARDSDVPSEALRISDYAKPLAALKLKASIIVLDAARANQFAKSGPALAGGLANVKNSPFAGQVAANAAAITTVIAAAGDWTACRSRSIKQRTATGPLNNPKPNTQTARNPIPGAAAPSATAPDCAISSAGRCQRAATGLALLPYSTVPSRLPAVSTA